LNRLLIATSNQGKFKEFQSLLASTFLCEPLPPNTPVVLEDGKTYRENALKKARGYYEMFAGPVLADDSGIEVDGLGGAPGVDSATFGGKDLSWPERWNHLFQKLTQLSPTERAARFRCVLCYYDGSNPPQFFEGTTEGYIAHSAAGTQGFGYGPIFYSIDLGRTLGEADSIDKDRVSHRARAVKSFLEWFRKNVS
jgi:XTP/dITP diphosphohydrolase